MRKTRDEGVLSVDRRVGKRPRTRSFLIGRAGSPARNVPASCGGAPHPPPATAGAPEAHHRHHRHTSACLCTAAALGGGRGRSLLLFDAPLLAPSTSGPGPVTSRAIHIYRTTLDRASLLVSPGPRRAMPVEQQPVDHALWVTIIIIIIMMYSYICTGQTIVLAAH